ncbi:hypothetical protein QBC35DRAFT_520493 [Podospora australis]|uniref:RING-type domain-containing protein n=1 Tax=Podospora australis TaxID=1536484 RepID=A0AAN7ALQ8_9PEZI|nr:hypothetical protein QBC35DRAFT_520493 [Podospora australis]
MSMFVDEIRNVVLLFSNPSWTGVGTVSSTLIRNVTLAASQFAYSSRYTGTTTVLSTRFAGMSNGVIQGLLYVPDLPYGDDCMQETAPYVPPSVTRQASLPPTNYYLIAIAPWTSAQCSKAYLRSARQAPVRGFIFYLPSNSTSDKAPPAESSVWDIEGDPDWKMQTGYPVYAISSLAGQIMMSHLSFYSGNLSQVPFGPNITDRFSADAEDYARIWTEIYYTSPSSGFGTWVYVLIVIGVLLAVIVTTSGLMHFVQARRRASLRRRVIAGEVNLEAMGIKRLTVPMDHIERLPVFTYHNQEATSPQIAHTRGRRGSRDQSERRSTGRASRSATMSEKGPSSPSARSAAPTNHQPFCEICLEPFQNYVTVIRELSCGHIFHPECIDEFLHEVSSLCPLCKASMLPKGFCPKITNPMVRRERAIRKIRGRLDPEEAESGKLHGWTSTIKNRIFSGASPASSTSTELQVVRGPRPSESRLHQHQQQQRPQSQQEPPQPSGQEQKRSEQQAGPTDLARERMRELAGTELDYGEAGGSSLWRRMRSRIFPGFD